MFKKYPSLTQSYATKDIDRYKTMFGEKAEACNWVISEKLHGANISFLFAPNKEVQYFSRNQNIVGANFYNSEDLFQEYIKKLHIFQTVSNKQKITIRLFGELFGTGIQKGVDYGADKRIKFFDMMINDKLIMQQEFENTMVDNKLGYLIVPKLGIVPKLQDALDYNTKFNSKLSVKEDNICEGIVIKPFDEVMVDVNGSTFYIKKKNEEFKEKGKPKKIKQEENYSEEVKATRELFLSYINENRVESVFSKEGEIQSMKDIGKYIPLIHKDALEDFNKENNTKFTKEEEKYIFNSSKHVVDILKTYL